MAAERIFQLVIIPQANVHLQMSDRRCRTRFEYLNPKKKTLAIGSTLNFACSVGRVGFYVPVEHLPFRFPPDFQIFGGRRGQPAVPKCPCAYLW